MRKLAFVFGCALISAPAVIARAQAQFTWIGWHGVPRTQGGGWCYVSGPHQHPYRALAEMPVTVQNGGYVYNGAVPNPPWFGYHQVPSGGWCYISGRHEHPYRPTNGWPVVVRDSAWVYTGNIPPPRAVAPQPGYGQPPIVAQPPAYQQPPATAYPPPTPYSPPPPREQSSDLAAHRIEARVVHARVIWAKEIKAEDVRCPNVMIEPLRGPMARGWEGEVRSERVDADVVRAHEIKAGLVEAQEIHVQKMRSGGREWRGHRHHRDDD
jgi:hypothetical protein